MLTACGYRVGAAIFRACQKRSGLFFSTLNEIEIILKLSVTRTDLARALALAIEPQLRYSSVYMTHTF
jgi:hypothetical protein